MPDAPAATPVLSTTRTSSPAFARCHAVDRPWTPAPTTRCLTEGGRVGGMRSAPLGVAYWATTLPNRPRGRLYRPPAPPATELSCGAAPDRIASARPRLQLHVQVTRGRLGTAARGVSVSPGPRRARAHSEDPGRLRRDRRVEARTRTRRRARPGVRREGVHHERRPGDAGVGPRRRAGRPDRHAADAPRGARAGAR